MSKYIVHSEWCIRRISFAFMTNGKADKTIQLPATTCIFTPEIWQRIQRWVNQITCMTCHNAWFLSIFEQKSHSHAITTFSTCSNGGKLLFTKFINLNESSGIFRFCIQCKQPSFALFKMFKTPCTLYIFTKFEHNVIREKMKSFARRYCTITLCQRNVLL